MGLTISTDLGNTSTTEQEPLPLASYTTTTASVFVLKKKYVDFFGLLGTTTTSHEYQLPILSPFSSHLYRQELRALTNEVAASVDQNSAPHQIVVSSGMELLDFIMVAHSIDALCEFLKNAAHSKTAPESTWIINDASEWFPQRPWLKRSVLDKVSEAFANIQLVDLSNVKRLEISVVPGVSTILSGITSLLEQDCLKQIECIALPFSAQSQTNLHHRSKHFYFPDKDRILTLEQFYGDIVKIGHQKLTQLKDVHFTLCTQAVTDKALAGLADLYPQLRTLIIDSATPTATNKKEFDTYILVEQHRASGRIHHGLTKKKAIYVDVLHIPGGDDLVALDKIIQAGAENNQLESLEIYHWIPGEDFPIFDQGRLAYYINSNFLPNLKKISICPPLDSTFPTKYLLKDAIASDTSYLSDTVLKCGGQIETLELLLPEAHGYKQWLLKILDGAFPKLNYLSYRIPDRHKGEEEVDYVKRVEGALSILQDIAEKYTTLKVCQIEGNILPRFKGMIKTIVERIARNGDDVEEFVD